MRGSDLYTYTDEQLERLVSLVQAEQTRRMLEASSDTDETEQPALVVTTRGCFRREIVRCGKAACWCAASAPGEGHGPYWYRYYRRGSKLVSKYVGKTLPSDIQLAAELDTAD